MNNGIECQFRQSGEFARILEEIEFPEVARESGTEMGILDITEALDQNRETQGPIHLARRSQEIMMAAIESHRLGGLRVNLPMENRSLYVGRPNW